MAVSASQITNFRKYPLGNSDWLVAFTYTGPASYTTGGETLTRAVCRQACEGISEIFSLSNVMATDGSNAVSCVFTPINDGTDTGTFQFFQGTDAHSHDFLVVGGQSAVTHTHDVKIIGGQASTTDNELAHYATDILGKEAATDATIAGADSATKGGVVAATASATAMAIYTDTIGKSGATDATIAGADSATKGGVLSGGSQGDSAPEAGATSNYSAFTANVWGIARM